MTPMIRDLTLAQTMSRSTRVAAAPCPAGRFGSHAECRIPLGRRVVAAVLVILGSMTVETGSLAAQTARTARPSTTAQPAPRPPSLGSSDTIAFTDAHVHLNDVAIQLELMRDANIARAIVFWGRSSTNATITDAARANPDRFIPFVSISPERAAYREQWTRNDTSLLAELDRELRTGRYAGIGEISVVHFPGEGFPEADFDPAGPMMRGIMRLAEQHRAPVMIHCEITRLDAFSTLLRAFPSVTVIWAHGGYTPYFLAERMLDAHPNLVYELSARTWAEHPRSPDYTIFRNETAVWSRWLALVERYPHRFLVGTDAAQRGNDRDKVSRVRLFLSQLTPPTRALVATDNLARILKR
jgi:predicted TIM-barrel fold metal-dependent hydrolase